MISNLRKQRELSFVVGLRLQPVGELRGFATESNYETFSPMFAKYFLQKLGVVFQENIFPVHFNNTHLFFWWALG